MKVGDLVVITETAACCRTAGFYNGFKGKIVRQDGYNWLRLPDGREHNFANGQISLVSAGDMPSKAKEITVGIRNQIRPYERYIMLGVLLIVVDHFIFKNKFQETIKELGNKIVGKVVGTLDSFIERL